MKKGDTFNILKREFINKWKIVLVLIGIILLSSYIRLVNPLIIRNIIDVAIPDKNLNLLLQLILLMVAVSILGLIIDLFKTNKTTIFGNMITSKLRKIIYAKAIRANILDIQNINPGQITNRITRECGRIELYVVNDLVGILAESIFLIILFITMYTINAVFTVIVFLLLPFLFFITKFVSKYAKKLDLQMLDILEKGQNRLNQTFYQIRNIKLKNGIFKEEEQWDSWLTEYERVRRKSNIGHNLNRFFMGDLISNLLYILIFLLGSWYIIKFDQMSIGSLVTFTAYVPKIYSSFRTILNLRVSTSVIKNSTDKIDQILQLENEYTPGKIITSKSLEIIFKNVDFSYKRGEFKLQNINFSVKTGERIGIIGLSGGGKTTLFDLITKMIKPQLGEILINDISINDLDTYQLREIIATVSQENNLFEGTIRDNIIYPYKYNKARYDRVIKTSKLDNLINTLEKKDLTPVKLTGEEFSGGEKQRIAIANALYKNASLFLLDEITSALDVENENDIMKEVYQMNDKIVLIISHRIYPLLSCDKIIIIENGKILEMGNTKNLLADKNSLLNKMINRISQSK